MKKKIIIAIIIILVIVISVAVYVGVNYKKIFWGEGFELPEGTIEFIEIGKNYQNAYNPIEISGKLAYIAQKWIDNKLKDIIVYGEEEIILDYENVKIEILADIDDKLTYTVEYSDASDDYQQHRYIQHGKERLVFDDYEFFGESMLQGTRVMGGYSVNLVKSALIKKDEIKKMGNIKILGIFNGKLLYLIDDLVVWGEEEQFYVPDEMVRGGMVNMSASLVNNKIALEITLCVPDGPCGTGILYNGKIIHKPEIIYWSPPEPKYYSISNPIEFNNKLTFIATIPGNVDVIVSDEKKISPRYLEIKGLNVLNGKLTYIALDDSKRKYKVIYGGEQLGGYYDFIYDYEMVGIGNKIAFVVVEKDKDFIVYNGEEIGKEYNAGRIYLTSFKNKLVFQVTVLVSKGWWKKESKTFIVVEK